MTITTSQATRNSSCVACTDAGAMPNQLATALWPSDALQIVARNRPIDVAVRMIGRAAPTAAAGTTPTSASPSDTEPAMKQGRPSAIGSPTSGPEAAAAASAAAGGS